MMTAIQNRALTGPHSNASYTTTASPRPQPEEFITKEEVAKRLKKSFRTIENWQRRGYIPFVKAGRSVLYKWSDIEAHLQQNFRVCLLPK